MAKEEKSIIEQALLEAEQIDATFKANAKEILSRTMGTEIEEMVKESLTDSPMAGNEDEDEIETTDLELGDDLDLDDESDDLDLDLGDDENDLDLELDVEDLTDADDEEVIATFKMMGPDDEIEIVQDEEGIKFKGLTVGEPSLEDDTDEDELDLDLEDDEETEFIDLNAGDELETDDDVEEEVVYEITIDEEEDEDVVDEGSRTLGSGRSHGRGGLPKKKAYKKMPESRKPSINGKLVKENRVLTNNINSLETENQELKENQEKLVEALKQFRQKLQEVAVFNSNLAHVVRLFTENTTTKEEKVDIVKRLDEAKSIKESKMLFKTISKELEGTKTKKAVKESVEEKLNETKTTGASQITESKVYVHPELEKMKSLWSFNYKY